ncbi:response regulator [Wenxinia marina]|uniref:Response regulator n=1 Tax=Wenxinia marina DSM 24838 TaxID=1123501 RepID=A0A0D0Q9D4_9RHOB|nr:response regulator [Wenxinia marina]KIQ68982.1 Response regulator [Wenxinia marina DSM 24838]GGL63591.1 hypothetical protein GCM10011392_17900 [Wenxinia marina]
MPTSLPADAPALSPFTVGRLDRPPTALVLDDSAFDRRRLSRLLDRICPAIEVIETSTVAQFEDALKRNRVELVFIDYLLAGWTGLAALDRLMADPVHGGATAIMLAGQGDLQIALQAMRRGCADYLEKASLSEETLTDALATTLARRMLNTALDARQVLETTLQRTALRQAAATGAQLRSRTLGAISALDDARIAGAQRGGPSLDRTADLLRELAGLVSDLEGQTARVLRRPARLI